MMKLTKLTLLLVLLSHTCLASTDYFKKDGVMIEGYDPVSYIKQNKAMKGSSDITYKYQSSIINFSSEENKKEFIDHPQKYLPAYKGWCSYAMAYGGELAPVDPKSFKVIDGKTHLFYNSFWANTLKKWNKKDDSSQVKMADTNWKKLKT